MRINSCLEYMKERIDYLSKSYDKLEKRPHIAVWQTSGEANHWYVSLDWQEKNKASETLHCQNHLTDWVPHQRAISVAMEQGRRLNLPVIKHCTVEVVLLSKPQESSTTEQYIGVYNLMRYKKL